MSADTLVAWRVLLVDDNALDRAESKVALLTGSSRRYAFSEAASADAAVTLGLDAPAFDCIVLDFEMPDGDALDVLARLPRDTDGLLHAAVLILTGGVPPGKHRALLRAGAQDYVGKAWLSPESLTRAVEHTVERHAMQRELNRHHNRQRLMAEGTNAAGDGRPAALLTLFERVGALVDADLQYHCLQDGYADAAGLPKHTAVGVDEASMARLAAACGDEAVRFRADASGSASLERELEAPLTSTAQLMASLGARASMHHQVVAGGRLIATLNFSSRTRDEFSRSDIDFVLAIGRQLSESSERWRVDAQLRDSEAFNSSLLDSSIDCVTVLDVDGRIQHLNENGRLLLELDNLDTMMQRKWSEFWPETARAQVDAFVSAAVEGHPSAFEGSCPTFSGTMKWWEVSLSPIRDAVSNKVSRVLVVSRDATSRRADAQALQQSREQLLAREHELRTLTDNAPDVMTRIDRDLRHVFVNAAVTRATGLLPSQIIGKTNRELGMPRKTCDIWDTALRRVFESGERHEIEFMFEGPLGMRHFVARLVPELSHDGSVLNVLGVTHDVTDRKDNERRRDELLEAERAARVESERVAIVKDEFLGTLSHELRTPLAAIVGWTNILKRPTVDAETVRRGIEVIARNGKMQARLIDDLLDMNRIISGKLKMEVGLVDLAMVAIAVVDTLRPSADAKGVTLDLVLADRGQAQVRGDVTRLQQVLSNLMGNAIKFTQVGGVVAVSTDILPGGAVTLSVKDTGKGIEPRFLPLLFDRFSQADGSAAREHGGLGLGLSIVHRLIELHGGIVTGHSEGVGQGALFVVTLPRAATETSECGVPKESLDSTAPVREFTTKASDFAPLGSEGDGALHGTSVLLVDDQLDVLELGRRVLAECGAEVRVAASGAAALAMLRTTHSDILISDIGMPGLDGYELIAQVRGVLKLDATVLPAVALTAFRRSQDHSRAIKAGYQAHLEKPIQPALLIQTVLELMHALAVRKS